MQELHFLNSSILKIIPILLNNQFLRLSGLDDRPFTVISVLDYRLAAVISVLDYRLPTVCSGSFYLPSTAMIPP
jgi:hypothetical protein